MKRPLLRADIERRLLINYRADPDAVARGLPSPLRPQLVNDQAIVGLCLIRLGAIRPRVVPKALGLTSENAAHRIAVEWSTRAGVQAGVYIPRRDSNSLANVLVGGRLYPGVHHRADFSVYENDDSFDVRFVSRDRSTNVHVHADRIATFTSQLFSTIDLASAFFRGGAVGLSPGHDGTRLQALELRAERWTVEPVAVTAAHSSFFDDDTRFPKGSIELDFGLLMHDVPVTWAAPVAASVRIEASRRSGVASPRDR